MVHLVDLFCKVWSLVQNLHLNLCLKIFQKLIHHRVVSSCNAMWKRSKIPISWQLLYSKVAKKQEIMRYNTLLTTKDQEIYEKYHFIENVIGQFY